MDDEALAWWSKDQVPCPKCGGTGVPVVLEITDRETLEAVRGGLACLGECCFDGARGFDRQCRSCGHEWASDGSAVLSG
jgi:hypothetical protein